MRTATQLLSCTAVYQITEGDCHKAMTSSMGHEIPSDLRLKPIPARGDAVNL